MVLLRQSGMHDRPVFHFLQGAHAEKNGKPFHFEESKFMFGEENLAPNLIEYDDEAELIRFLGSKTFLNTWADVDSRFEKKSTFILTKISGLLKTDLKLEYFRDSLAPATIEAASVTFLPLLGLSLQIEQSSKIPKVFSSEFFRDKYFAIFEVASNLVYNRHLTLSPRYHLMFSEQKYVDSQVPFIMLGPCLFGSASNK